MIIRKPCTNCPGRTLNDSRQAKRQWVERAPGPVELFVVYNAFWLGRLASAALPLALAWELGEAIALTI